MRNGWRTAAAGLALVVASTVSLVNPSAAVAAPDWTIEPVPFLGGNWDMAFTAVAAGSPANLLAVGWEGQRSGGAVREIIQIRRRSPAGEWRKELVSATGRLTGVTAVTAQEAWAVGTQPGVAESALAFHLVRGRWSRVPTPPLGGGTRLNAVAAVSTDDVWAVGSRAGRFAPYPLIEHWNGTAWSLVSGPGEPAGDGVLYGVAARAANDVWAVGARATSPPQPLVKHWDGRRWSVVDVPGLRNRDSSLRAVAAVSASDVWAVGASGLIEHYDGVAWKIVSSVSLPEPQPAVEFTAVAARSAQDVWLVGHTGGTRPRALTRHWDGSTWVTVPAPNPGTSSNELYGVVTPADGSTTVVGLQVSDGAKLGLAARR
jgi:hypothetical protein